MRQVRSLKKYRKRWRLENVFAELKNDWHIDKLPSSDFEKIDTFIMLTLIAYNLTVYLKSHLKELAKPGYLRCGTSLSTYLLLLKEQPVLST